MADQHRSPLDRRTLLRGAGSGVVAATWLVGCGSDDEGSGSTETQSEPTTLSAGDVAVGSGVILDDTYVVTQPTEGEFKAFTAICTHNGCPVASVKDDTITCNCHGSQYDAAPGEVTRGPATEALAEVALSVDGDTLTVG